MIDKGANAWDSGLEGAGRGTRVPPGAYKGGVWSGHRSVVSLMIDKGANDWNRGLEGQVRVDTGREWI